MWLIIIPFLATLIGAILGWFLRDVTCNCEKETKKIEELEQEIKALKSKLKDSSTECEGLKLGLSKLTELEDENKSLNLKLNNSLSENESLKLDLSNLETKSVATTAVVASSFDKDLAKQFLGKRVVADDLTIVEGIGPKISGLFEDGGISTWKQLSETSIEKCQEILDGGGSRYRVHNPKTWPKQALLAFEGKWEELAKWQDELDGGK